MDELYGFEIPKDKIAEAFRMAQFFQVHPNSTADSFGLVNMMHAFDRGVNPEHWLMKGMFNTLSTSQKLEWLSYVEGDEDE